MSEANALDKITAYMAKNRINAALEAKLYQKMALEAIFVEKDEKIKIWSVNHMIQSSLQMIILT